ncbi:uncharacterized protein TNCV_1879311 [Trichonephila clavipes]|nr:uncharacterized protein TNCV_1879311 [Trichonephila clavipes]
MDEQLKALLEGINDLKNIIGNVEKRQEDLRNILEKKIEQVEERYERVAGNFSLISQRVEDFEKKLLACGNAMNESKFVPAAPVPVPASPVSVKLYTYDGKTNWEVGEASEVLQTLTDTELLNLNSLYNALDLRFGRKFSKDYARLQMKTRHQKPEESLQEYAFEMQRLTTLAFSDFSANVREMISLEYFVVGIKDEEIQMSKILNLQCYMPYGNIEAPSRRPCTENSKYSWRVEKKFGVIDPVVRQVTTPSTSESDP